MGAVGSSGKKGCSLVVSGARAAAAEAYCLWNAIGARLLAICIFDAGYDGRMRLAVQSKEAIVDLVSVEVAINTLWGCKITALRSEITLQILKLCQRCV